MPSSATLPPWFMCSSMSAKAAGTPDISRPTSKPSVMPSSVITSRSFSRADVHGARRAHPSREVEPVVVDVGDDDVARADVARDRRRHDADRARRR